MKKDDYEIYSVRFNKLVTDKDIHFTTYTVGSPVLGHKVPLSIILNGNKIVVEFSDSTRHTFHYGEDVEIFTRKIEKPKNKRDEKISNDSKDQRTESN
jgi:hypothetical protein